MAEDEGSEEEGLEVDSNHDGYFEGLREEGDLMNA